jgi:predicted kinase
MATLNRGGERKAIRTNKDEIRTRLSKKGINSESSVIRRETEIVTKALKAGLAVIIDNTHFHPPHEVRYRQLAEEYGYKFVIKSFTNVPVEVCIRRDQKRRNPVGAWVIREMYSKYLSQEPTVVKEAAPVTVVKKTLAMKDLPLSKVYQLLEPGPVVLLTTAHKGHTNVMTMSWHMMVEFEPPLVAECFANLECKVVDTRLASKFNLFILKVIKAWVNPAQKHP